VTEPDFLRDTRASYDAVAVGYAERFRDELAAKPLDRAMLAGFAELVRAASAGPAADIGCGTGRVTAYLNDLGLPTFGVDLSPQMVAVARRSYPGLRFEVGSMLALDIPDGSVGGMLAWYSTIHVPDERLPDAFAGFCRVLAPGGHALLACQVGDEPLHLAQALGHPVSLDFHQRQPERVAELLDQAGLVVRADIHSPAYDQVLGPVPQREVPVGVEAADVAGVQPAFPQSLGGGIWLVPVAGHDHIAPDHHLTDLVGRQFAAVVDDADLDVGTGGGRAVEVGDPAR
jgi:SAM-dependent methyltransferase